MRTYEFMDRAILEKINIQREVKESFKIKIDENTFSNLKEMRKALDKIFRKEIEENLQNDWNGIRAETETEEIKYLNKTVTRVKETICDLNMYYVDLNLDIFMGILRADGKCDIPFYCEWEEKWKKGAYNRYINVENAKRHYPFVDRFDFLEEGIPGGCKEYHDLMILQGNLDIFDINDSTEGLTRYAFPKTYKIYEKLKKSLFENMILLEETLGVAYTNHIYHYVKEIKEKEKLEKLLEVIQKGLEIGPMFLRNKVMDAIMEYMEKFSYSEKSIMQAKKILEGPIVDDINMIYDRILEFEWYACWLAYKKNKLDENFVDIQKDVKDIFKADFNMDEVYEDWIQEMNIHDWRNIKTVDDCFFYIDKRDYNPVDVMMKKGVPICIITTDGEQESFWVSKSLNLLGDKIFNRAIEEMGKLGNSIRNKQEWSQLYEDKKKEIFEEIKKKEKQIWENQELKAPKKKLKLFHTYAMIHRAIIKKLNEIE